MSGVVLELQLSQKLLVHYMSRNNNWLLRKLLVTFFLLLQYKNAMDNFHSIQPVIRDIQCTYNFCESCNFKTNLHIRLIYARRHK